MPTLSELTSVVVSGLSFFYLTEQSFLIIKYLITFICQNANSVLLVLNLSNKDLP